MRITKIQLRRLIREAYEEVKEDEGYFDWIDAGVKVPKYPDDEEYMAGWNQSISDDKASSEHKAEKEMERSLQPARDKTMAAFDRSREKIESDYGISDDLAYEIEMGMLFLAKEDALRKLANAGGRQGLAAKKLLDMSPAERNKYKGYLIKTLY